MALNTYHDEKRVTDAEGKAKAVSGNAEGNHRFEARYKIQKPLGVFQARMGGLKPDNKNSGS